MTAGDPTPYLHHMQEWDLQPNPRTLHHHARLLEGVARFGSVRCDAFDLTASQGELTFGNPFQGSGEAGTRLSGGGHQALELGF